MKIINKIKAELEQTRKLLEIVNSEEEYNLCKADEARLLSLLSTQLKGGKRRK
ncbi:hypothetical protein JXA85_00395 [Candidatus Woesearchaeota archaeon]|nr:hypothetical protein [Candidatus Woesearchaeota archaeon]